MSIQEKEQEIIDEFSMYDDWMDKYAYIIELGKQMPKIEEGLKTKERLISGCQSQVWLETHFEEGKMKFTADSDAIITKGLMYLLIRVADGETPIDVAKLDFGFIKEIGLQEHLSPTRSNGLLSMVQRMKMEALKLL